MVKKTHNILAEPYFLHETSKLGEFYIVESIVDMDGDNYRIRYHSDEEDLTILTLNQDIIETPNRNIELYLDINTNNLILPSVIREVKKLCQISFHDYVTLEPYGEGNFRATQKRNGTYDVIFRPRLFRRANNN